SPERVPPRVRRLALPLAAGWHRVALKIAAVGGRAEAELALVGDGIEAYGGDAAHAPATTAGHQLPARVLLPALPEPRNAPDAKVDRALVDFLAAHAAFRTGDNDAGEAALARLTERAPKFAPALLLAAQLRTDDTSRASRLARDRG